MNDFTSVIKDAIINYSMETKDYICQYCGKAYRKESTLAAHLCEPKRRAQQENEAGVKLGMTAYLRFYELTTGRISAWIIFNCASGQQALDKLSTEQIEMIFPYIDPDYWKRKFVDYFADTEWVKHILKEAGL